MDISTETLDKVAEIVRTELPKRLPENVRVHKVSAHTMMGRDDEVIHVIVIYEGDRKNLNPKALNEFDLEIEPLLLEMGVDDLVPISYVNRREVDGPSNAHSATSPGSLPA